MMLFVRKPSNWFYKTIVLSSVLLLSFSWKNANAALNVASITTTANSSGLAASPLNATQGGIAVIGISVKSSTGSNNITGFTFSGGAGFTSYFSNFKLYSSTDNTYNPGTDPQVTSSSYTISGSNVIFTIPSKSITTTTVYYFLIADYTVASSTSSTFTFNITGVSGTTPTIGASAGPTYTVSARTFIWEGGAGSNNTTKNDWNTGANWDIGTVPSTYDAVQICYTVNPGNYFPVISSGSTNTVASVTIGGRYTVSGSLTVNGSLRVNGDITLPADAYPGEPNEVYLQGTGSVAANNLTISSNYNSGSNAYQQNLNISIAQLTLSGNLALISENYNGNTHNSIFTVTAGTTEIDGNIQTTNDAGSTSTIQISPASSAGATLELDGAAALSGLSGTGTNVIDFNNQYSTVNYSGTTQTVYTATTANVSGGGVSYYNLNLSGTTAKPSAGTLTVLGNFYTTATTADLATNNNPLTVSGISYINGGTINLGSGAYTTSNGLDVYGTAVFNAGSGSISDPNFFRINVDYGNATVNLGSGTATFGQALVLYGGTLNCGTGTMSVAGSSQIYANATVNAGSSPASLIFTGTYQNYSGGKFSEGTGTVTFKSSYDNEGTCTYGAGTMVFTGGATQSVKDGSSGGTPFNNVTFNGTGTTTLSIGTAGSFSVASTGTLTMTSPAKLNTGVTTANTAYLTLKSDANSTATVAPILTTSTSIITGNVNVQRYLPGGSGYRGYRLFSSPVNITGLNTDQSTTEGFIDPTYLNTGILTAGPGTGFKYPTAIANPLMYLYDESRTSNNKSFVGGKNVGIKSIVGSTGTASTSYLVTPLSTTGATLTTAKVPVGNSILAFYIGPSTYTTLTNTAPDPSLTTACGFLNQGTIPLYVYSTGTAKTLSYSSPTNTAATSLGLNQVGNPYPSTISLDSLYYDNGPISAAKSINSTFWELKSPGGTYVAYNAASHAASVIGSGAGSYIVSGQGFFVSATTTGKTLTFYELEKVNKQLTSSTAPPLVLSQRVDNATTANLAEAPEPGGLEGLHLQITKDTATYTQTGIYFSNSWTDKFDPAEDAVDLDGTSPKVYLSSYSSDGLRLCINELGSYTKGKTVKLYAAATTDGAYTISLADITNIDPLYNIYLRDHHMNDSLDIRKYNSYTFNIVRSDTTTYGANRFDLVFELKSLPKYALVSFTGQKVNSGVQLNWKTYNESNYTGFTLQKQGADGNFSPIYSVQSDSLTNYGFVDQSPVTGNNIYRLQQSDIVGNITYSAPVTIGYNNVSSSGLFSIYPNPAKSMINVKVNSATANMPNYIAEIYNTSGTLIEHKVLNTNTWTEDVSNYKEGMYVITLKNNNGDVMSKAKFIKVQ